MTAWIAAAVFGFSALALAYVYAGFPALLWLLTRRRKPAAPAGYSDKELPAVSYLVAAYNEEAVIQTKIDNCLALDYPPEKLHFVFVSDGSADATNEILEANRGERITVLLQPRRGGKIRALKAAFPLCRNEILVLTDANAYFHADALRKLVRHFRDPRAGVVTGDVRLLPSGAEFGRGEGAYYRYERALQAMESQYWSAVGVDGAMYALRRRLLVEPWDGCVLDDFVISMNAARQGYRIIYEPEAIAEEEPTPSSGQEFWRKVRIVAGGYQALWRGEGVPGWEQWRLLWLYVSHKLLRWLAPLLLLAAWAASLALWLGGAGLLWGGVFLAQALFYALAAVNRVAPRLDHAVFRIPYYFTLVNLAALVGLWRALRGTQGVTWRKAARGAEGGTKQ